MILLPAPRRTILDVVWIMVAYTYVEHPHLPTVATRKPWLHEGTTQIPIKLLPRCHAVEYSISAFRIQDAVAFPTLTNLFSNFSWR